MDGTPQSQSTSSRSQSARTLGNIDWSFESRGKADGVEGVHPYPAKFIGELPRALLSTLKCPENTAVLDPFCGSGTTLVESQRAGLPSVGIDLNPIACLISRVKTRPLPSGFDDAISEVVGIAQSIGKIKSPNIPNLDHWFTKTAQQAVGALSIAIADERFAHWGDQLRLSLSSILVRVSNQESDTRYAAVEKQLTQEGIFNAFIGAGEKLSRALSARSWKLKATEVIEGDTLAVTPSQIPWPIGMVVTSPPYPNAYEYWLYHKYRMWWLGFDPLAVKEREIGARAHFFKKNPHESGSFSTQMRTTFGLICDVLVDRGFVCFVVGRSKIRGLLVDNGALIEEVAREAGLTKITRIERKISSTRKSFNLSHANIKTESILVFQKK